MLNTALDQHIIHLLGGFLKIVGEQVNLQKNRSDMSYQSFAHFTNRHLQVKHTPSLKHPNPAIQRFGEFSLQATRRMEGTISSFNALGLGVFGRLGGYVDKDPEGLKGEVGTKCRLINMTKFQGLPSSILFMLPLEVVA